MPNNFFKPSEKLFLAIFFSNIFNITFQAKLIINNLDAERRDIKPSAQIKNIGNAEAPVVQSPYIEKSFPKYTSRASGEAKISSREP